jgi:very-short-patch-repair endonuclease
MRAVPIYAEACLWKTLRQELLKSAHFRRQVALGPYIADFASHGARLVVEADGGIHADDQATLHDAKRDAWLTSRGYRVVRLPNDLVVNDPSAVIEIILKHTATTPTPTPPLKGRAFGVDDGLQLHRRTVDAARHPRELSGRYL